MTETLFGTPAKTEEASKSVADNTVTTEVKFSIISPYHRKASAVVADNEHFNEELGFACF
jgi:hypothetical protein